MDGLTPKVISDALQEIGKVPGGAFWNYDQKARFLFDAITRRMASKEPHLANGDKIVELQGYTREEWKRIEGELK